MIATSRSVALSCLLATAALAGCGDGDAQTLVTPSFSVPTTGGTPQPAPVTTTPVPLITDSTVTSATTSTTTAVTTTATTAPPAPPPITGPVVALASFSSPSGNIGCFIAAGSTARCDAAQVSFFAPTRPPDCTADWGHAVVLDPATEPATFVCASDTTLGAPAVLPYGTTSSIGQVACQSREDGMQCWNTQTNHGFRLARESFELY